VVQLWHVGVAPLLRLKQAGLKQAGLNRGAEAWGV
jgi:hypothetical protein